MASHQASTFLLIHAVLLAQLAAQTPLSLRGRILDPTHAAIVGAQITANSDILAAKVSAVTGEQGAFEMHLPPGKYVIKVVKDGFVEISQSVEVSSPVVDLPEIVLAVAPVRAAMTVSERTGYLAPASSSATKTLTPLRDVPQSITVVTNEQIQDQMMTSIGDVVRYVPGVTASQGENNRDQLVIRGNSTSADFFLDGVRDDVQYYRDVYNLDRVEALKGPNAMIFGRGGAGGVINRVTKEAGPTPLREITIDGGSYGDKRFTVDLDQPVNDKFACRVNGMYENSGNFRDYVNLERYGIDPTITINPSKNTRITLGYENFRDNRGSDRGIPSFQGLPLDVPVNTFFGNPNLNTVRALVNIGTATIEHQITAALTIRNRTLIGDYDRGYQNFVPGAVNAAGTQDSLSAYNNATQRRNIFNQTELTYIAPTGRLKHTLLAGVEVGRQLTNNFRNTGYFNNTDTTLLVPLSNTVIGTPTTFRQGATDADNHPRTNIGASYLQDQIELSSHVQLIAGLRFDHFDLQYHNNRTGENIRRIDNLVSPRLGLVYKPIAPVSIYASYSVSFLPSSGDQFSSLTTVTQQVKPERFNNYEAGVKWDFVRFLSLTTAVYRLDRTNTRSTDPNDPTRIVQTGSQRTNGYEIGLTGSVTRAWKIAGGYAYQDAFVNRATTAARAGAQVGQVPHNTFSLWNSYQIIRRLGAGLGILNRSDMFAAIDDTVVLRGYTRADAAVYYSLTEHLRVQANVENVFDKKYYLNADNNNNISPGSPRAFRIGLTARF
jgi:catecholate siderophore receptor